MSFLLSFAQMTGIKINEIAFLSESEVRSKKCEMSQKKRNLNIIWQKVDVLENFTRVIMQIDRWISPIFFDAVFKVTQSPGSLLLKFKVVNGKYFGSKSRGYEESYEENQGSYEECYEESFKVDYLRYLFVGRFEWIGDFSTWMYLLGHLQMTSFFSVTKLAWVKFVLYFF